MSPAKPLIPSDAGSKIRVYARTHTKSHTKPHPIERVRLATNRLGLVAGEGFLPVSVAKNAVAQGISVVAFSIDAGNVSALKTVCEAVYPIVPGMLEQNLALLRQERIEEVVFAGKVNKWILLKNPRLDRRALTALKQLSLRGDDAVMLRLIELMGEEGLRVLPQTAFLQDHFVGEAVLAGADRLSTDSWRDVAYGFHLAKHMGTLDVGQTVVVKDGMVLAVEAIEGTDVCLERAGKLAKKRGGTVVKVAKPNQDNRFDVPTVGLRTLKTMCRFGLTILATDANNTLYLDLSAMQAFAERRRLSILSVSESLLAEQTENAYPLDAFRLTLGEP